MGESLQYEIKVELNPLLGNDLKAGLHFTAQPFLELGSLPAQILSLNRLVFLRLHGEALEPAAHFTAYELLQLLAQFEEAAFHLAIQLFGDLYGHPVVFDSPWLRPMLPPGTLLFAVRLSGSLVLVVH
ncbi:MAG: hypothetical protein BUE48_003750 [Thermomonospora sp. CIF 1]|nr:MAG: hypothetical protein BUE48_003750 [Thermomonospora sp. CIF 1]